MKFIYMVCILLVISFFNDVSAYTCEEESNLFGITQIKSCPGAFDSKDSIYCCGPKEHRRCCDTLLGLKEEDLKEIAEYIPTLIGIVVSVILGLIVCCLVCCCCCPFCLLHKKRNRGVIHQPTAAERTNQPPAQPSYAPVQSAPYPTQPAGYPSQPPLATYPTQPGYPPAAPYPTQQPGYPPAAPYPTQVPPQGFAPPPVNTSIQMESFTGDQPPPYSEKQQPYNPNY